MATKTQVASRTAPKVPPKSTQVPAKAGTNAAVPDYLRNEAGVGTGLSTDASDNLVPLIYILQPLSPQVMKKNPAYIPDAEAGDIWLKNANDPIVKGDEGIIFQPCHFWKSWTEWVPRDKGGGFVATYADEGNAPVNIPDDAEKEEGGFNYIRENGNKIVANRNYAGFVYGHGPFPLPFVIILASTGHTFGRQWMTAMNNALIAEGGGKYPIWAKKWKLTTVHKSNTEGEWFMYEAHPIEGYVSKEEFAAGKKLNLSFSTGEKRAATDEEGSSFGDPSSSSDDAM